MATTLFLRALSSDWSSGNNDANLAGAGSGWTNDETATSRGSSVNASPTNTVTGPTNGIEMAATVGALAWITPPLAAAVTISGSITWNIWAAEANAKDNVAINGRLDVIDGATGAITLIDQTVRTTEVALTTRAVNNFSKTPAAGVACKKGDRLRIRIFGDDAGTMASGGSFTIGFDAGSAGIDGDTFLTLTETLSFVSEPAGTTVYLTDTASAVSTASVDREAWTSRGAGVQTDVTNTVAGWTAPIQVTDTAGGTVVDWFTRPLTAFTLGGAVRCNIRAAAAIAANSAVRVQIARVDGDGTNASVWGVTSYPSRAPTSEGASSFRVSGDDLSVSNGQRLRIRLYIDDIAAVAMGASQTVTTYYAGTSGGASGDTYLTFSQTLTEYSASVTATPGVASLTTATFAPTVTASANVMATPDRATLALASFAATVTASSNQTVTPGLATLALASSAPTISTPVTTTPAVAALALTSFAPTVTASAHITVTPVTASLAATTYAPAVAASANIVATPPTIALTLTTFAPHIPAPGSVEVVPETAHLTLTTYAPTVTATISEPEQPPVFGVSVRLGERPRPRKAVPRTARLRLVAFEPVVRTSDIQRAMPQPAALYVTTYSPRVRASDVRRAEPDAAHLSLGTFVPTVRVSDDDEAVLVLVA